MTSSYVGLKNLGNTCFINSFIQILRCFPTLNALLDDPAIIHELKVWHTPETLLMLEWNELRKTMNQQLQPTIICPKRFIYVVRQVARLKRREDIGTENMQCDMDDFFHFFFSDPEPREGRRFNFDRLWMGEPLPQHISEILTIDGKHLLSSTKEHYSVLNLEIPIDLGLSEISLYDCLNDYTCSEILDGENKWFNDKTQKHQDIQKRIRFLTLPKILIIILKRFSPDGLNKINTFVNYPLDNFVLNPYLQHWERDQVDTNNIYNLFGVCFHSGMLRGGHYTAATRLERGEWMYFDDEKMFHVSPQNLSALISNNAYCFFYSRKTS